MKLQSTCIAIAVGLSILLALGSGQAMANPFAKGNADNGKKLHDPKCMSCHNSMFPDKDGTQLYSEMFRKVDSHKALKGMVEFCSNRTNSGWFEEDIQHVSRYLNDSYYKFK